MRFLALTAATLASISYAHAWVAFTNDEYNGITAGKPFTLTWNGDGTPVTITLMNGLSDNLVKVSVIASTSNFPISTWANVPFNEHEASAVASSYTWTPDSSLVGTYALSIAQTGDINYSPQFTIAGGSGSSSPPPTIPTPTSSVPAYTSSSSSFVWSGTTASWKTHPTPAYQALAAMLPPFPAGVGNSSNSTGLYASISGGGGVPIPSFVGYGGNASVPFTGGSGRMGLMNLAVGLAAFMGAVWVGLAF